MLELNGGMFNREVRQKQDLNLFKDVFAKLTLTNLFLRGIKESVFEQKQGTVSQLRTGFISFCCHGF